MGENSNWPGGHGSPGPLPGLQINQRRALSAGDVYQRGEALLFEARYKLIGKTPQLAFRERSGRGSDAKVSEPGDARGHFYHRMTQWDREIEGPV